MKKLNLYVVTVIVNFAVIFLPFYLSAQVPYIKWQRSFGGLANDCSQSIQQTTDGGYVTGGFSLSNLNGNHGGADYWIVKLDTVGNIEWQKCFGGSYNDIAYFVEQTNDDGYIIAGITWSSDGDVVGNHGGSDCWIVKLNSTGEIEWQKCFGGSNDEESYSIKQTNDGGYVVTGYTFSNNGNVSGYHGGYDFWIFKIDSIGIIEWQKCLGGTYDDVSYSINQTLDGGYIISGYSRSSDGDLSVNQGNSDFWVIKLNLNYEYVENTNLFSGINIYPNPIDDIFNLDFNIDKYGLCEFRLYDFLGQIIFSEKHEVQQGINKLYFNISGISSGIYLFRIYNNRNFFNQIIIKK